ncbi:MAG: flavodoxin family protein [Ruminococcus sp.]|uniref:flavodoxin family protein n=1 Tax=Ruminococcus sp. TaxID=41978 RepID=UPI0025DE6575|nr:flavodoxin family protein [Ruminococcus sp.]MCR5600388.1 flavodoxin family protein [Ruminococcus sp.]
MKVLVITGSPHKNGTSAYLAEQFIKGAEEAGHEVCRFDAAFKDIHPCIACEKCHGAAPACVFKDDMAELNPHLIEADAVVLASPIYYYAVSAQLKAVIDRFYANDAVIHGGKKAVLMVTMADDNEETADGAATSFKGMTKYLEWDIAGTVIAVNCMTLDMLKKTDYPVQAYELGKAL